MSLKSLLKRIVPKGLLQPLLNWRRYRDVRWGNLRRLEPVSRNFGWDRGQPIDRYYIEQFLSRHAEDVRGITMEVGSPAYAEKFGRDRIARIEVLHVHAGNPKATLIGDLSTGAGIPLKSFDCIILTQTLPFIFEAQAAVRHAYEALKPSGVLLATCPGISQISRTDMKCWGDYWRFTDASMRKLFGDVFGGRNVTVETHGNVLAASAFLQGLAAHELIPRELELVDSDYQVIIAVRAVKAE